jgi:tetratricopeptide (TPR) repeat protein
LEHALTVLGQLEPSERGTSWLINDVAEALREQGRRQEARALFAEALDARRAALGNDDPGTLTSLNNLGLLLREMGELAGAKALLEEAVAARRKAQGDAHPETLTAINNLGALLKAQGALVRTPIDRTRELSTRADAALRDRRCNSGAEHACGCGCAHVFVVVPYARAARRPGVVRGGAGDATRRTGRRAPRHAHLDEQPGLALPRAGQPDQRRGPVVRGRSARPAQQPPRAERARSVG